jgi:hypothetical protein
MSDEIKPDGGCAFPAYLYETQPYTGQQMVAKSEGGMTLRDYFAAASLSSMMIAPDYSKGPCDTAIAQRAYFIADAMLKERVK